MAIGVLACLWWGAQSITLVLASKSVFEEPLFDFPWTITFIQCLLVSTSLAFLSLSRGEPPPLRRAAFLDLLTPTALFSLYAFSNARALRFISLPAFTVVKSLAPLGVTTVERVAFGDPVPLGVYAALAVALLANVFTFDSASAVSHLSLRGYAWALLNVSAHIFYVLALRYCSAAYGATAKALHVNMLAMALLAPMACVNREPMHFWHQAAHLPPAKMLPLVLACALGAGCAVSVLSAMEAASSDGLRYLAVSNKIVVVLLGAYIFRTEFSPIAWVGVTLAVASGFLFVYSKSRSQSSLGIPRPIVSSPTLELLLPNADDDEPVTASASPAQPKKRQGDLPSASPLSVLV